MILSNGSRLKFNSLSKSSRLSLKICALSLSSDLLILEISIPAKVAFFLTPPAN